ncbi:transposase [Rhodococcus olei]|uniref:transposase n=1 Tax=Rhodococcus olei TaxID=2161675 RepID=UPI003CD062E5
MNSNSGILSSSSARISSYVSSRYSSDAITHSSPPLEGKFLRPLCIRTNAWFGIGCEIHVRPCHATSVPKPYPPELRRAVLHALRQPGATQKDVSRQFGVAVNSVWRWAREADELGATNVDPTEHDPGELHRARMRITHLEHEVDVLTEALALLARRSRRDW